VRVDARMEETRLEPFTPPQQPMREVPLYDFWEAFGLDDKGQPLDPVDVQAERLQSVPGVRVHRHTASGDENGEEV
jgi:hypothetical protein